MTDQQDLRDKIARALFDQDYNGKTRRASDTAWLLMLARIDGDSTWHRAADAVLAVLDLDAVRAEAQVEVLNAEADYLSTVHLAWKELYVGILRDRADRIAREAGIETGGKTDD